MRSIAALLVLVSTGLHVASMPARAMPVEEAARQLEAMSWYSEEYPPYNFAGKDGVPTGISVDILLAAFEKLGVRIAARDFKIVPWNRSYRYVLNRPGKALFSMTYAPEREKLMKFVGPAAPSNVSVFALKGKRLEIKAEEDLTDLRIGVVRDDIGDQLVRSVALQDELISRKNSLKQVIFLLERDRVDAIAYASSVLKHYLKTQGRYLNNYEEVYVLKNGEVGYAFHKSVDSECLAVLQAAIDELRADGTIDDIIAKY